MKRMPPYGAARIDSGPTSSRATAPSPQTSPPGGRSRNRWVPGRSYWFKWTAPGKIGNGNCYGGEIVSVSRSRVHWIWLDDDSLVSRAKTKLDQQRTEKITDLELQYLQSDSTLHRDEVRRLIAAQIPPDNPTPSTSTTPGESQVPSLEGFWDTLNQSKWMRALQWLEADFTPEAFLIRRPPTSAPFGTARQQFVDVVRAATNLLAQFSAQDDQGYPLPNPKYDQMQMLIRSLPILLLRASSIAQRHKFTQVVNRRCALFLKGDWELLYHEALSDCEMQNTWDRTHLPKRDDTNKQRMTLDQARKLNYSKAMTILQSPGLAMESSETLLTKLQALHPPDVVPSTAVHSDIRLPASTYKFIDGPWVRRQILRNKRGTAVDQWGWDSREMWRDIITDNELLGLVARHWILPIAMGYLPVRYREHLAGGRLVALSKSPKPGIRPINVTDTWRRIATKGLLQHCKTAYRTYFQDRHPRVFQYAAAQPDGATIMFQLIQCIVDSIRAGITAPLDPVEILAADARNAFNEESRQYIREFHARQCPIHLDNTDDTPDKNWDILWRYIQAHYEVDGILKLYHGGRVHHILSRNGIQQGDTAGTVLFSAPLQPILEEVADAFPLLLILAFADNAIFIGPRSQILMAADLYKRKIQEKGLKLNPAESRIYSIQSEPNNCPSNMITPQGLEIPCTAEGMVVLGAPIGTAQFVQTVGRKIIQKIEAGLAQLKNFPYLHQRAKMATFCVNTQPGYLMGTMDAENFRDSLSEFDDSVDKFWADLLQFPADFQSEANGVYKRALHQIRFGIRDGGSGCYRNEPFLDAAQYCTLARTLKWCAEHPVSFPWLSIPVTDILRQKLQEAADRLKTWGLPVAQTLPRPEQNKRDLPLQIPAPNLVAEWPDHLFPTRGDFGKHIKSKLKAHFKATLQISDLRRYSAVCRQQLRTHKKSHLQSESENARGPLWQCSTSLFSLCSFYELSNEALVHSTALILGTPLPHALFLKAHVANYANIDVWGDSLLNDPAHAGATRKITHDKFALELSKIANECGLPTTCKESQLPYRDQGKPNQSRKRADMMTYAGGCVCENPRLNFTKRTRLIMDVTIGHVHDVHHNFKVHNLRNMETRKRTKYLRHYLQQRLAFAPMVANTIGQCGPDCLQFLWILADHDIKTKLHPDVEESPHTCSNLDQSMSSYSENYQRQRGRKFNENRLRMLTCIYEAVTERIFGVTFDLSTSAQYRSWLRQTRHNWQNSIPEYDLSSQSSESITSSRAETLSLATDSLEPGLVDQLGNDDSGGSQLTRVLESQTPRLPSAGTTEYEEMDATTSSLSVTNVPLVVAYERGCTRRRRSEELHFTFSTSQSDDTPRPAQRRCLTHIPFTHAVHPSDPGTPSGPN